MIFEANACAAKRAPKSEDFEDFQDIWLRELARDTDTRFTTTGFPFASLWSPKGDRIVFPVNVGGLVGILQKASSGSGKEEMLLPATSLAIPYHWSRDGRSLV